MTVVTQSMILGCNAGGRKGRCGRPAQEQRPDTNKGEAMKGTVKWLVILALVAGTALAGGTSAAPVSGYGYLPKGTEIVELRDEFSKHYSNGDGTITAEIHNTPIHRLDENGRWVETDATQNFTSNGDSYVDSQNAGTNYGNATTLYVYKGSGVPTPEKRAIVKFNFGPSSLPSGSTINSAQAYIYVRGNNGITSTVRCYENWGNWTEVGVTWNNKPGYNNSPYYSPEGLGAPAWYTIDITTFAQDWFSGTANQGITLSTTSYMEFKFDSEEGTNKP